jgi:arginase
MKKDISIIGVPMWLGQTRYGTNMGPGAIRSAGLLDRLKRLQFDVMDEGNVPIGIAGQFKRTGENMKNVKTVAKSSERLAAKVSDMIRQDRFPLVLGGDHSIAIGTLAGVVRHYKNLGVIWYDAHADMNTPETSPSGNIHGMPLAVSMGIGQRVLTEIGGCSAKVKPENVVLIGARDLDPGEWELIARKKIRIYTADDVKKRGIAQVIGETLQYLSACDGIHLSFDLDGVDPKEIPGVGTPVKAGISYADSISAVRLLAQAERITSAEFVEVNPLLDKADTTAMSTVNLIGALFGEGIKEKYAAEQCREAEASVI